ncbi:hypothetical protein AC578_6703 [Pseudocercospora eumusae]|uniref:Uncharacterized protein n=1 Tax=Pseudocercospora eumusae TaxID=321146 RepID=A0A139HIA2_9PEZI|nr:hypothetical protein AC578_6703 [Pseudocercospora eumusae]
MKVATPQSSAGKTLALSSRASAKTYTPRTAPMPSLSAYRAAEKTIPGITNLKRKHDESVEQDYESEREQEDGDSDQMEEEEGQKQYDSGSEHNDGAAEISTSRSAEIKQDYGTSSDSHTSSSDSGTALGAGNRSENVIRAGKDGSSSYSKDDLQRQRHPEQNRVIEHGGGIVLQKWPGGGTSKCKMVHH